MLRLRGECWRWWRRGLGCLCRVGVRWRWFLGFEVGFGVGFKMWKSEGCFFSDLVLGLTLGYIGAIFMLILNTWW